LKSVLGRQVYKGLRDAARGIVKQHGVRGLFRGLGVTLVEIIPYAALQFGLYDVFTSMYRSAVSKAGRSHEL
jgi:solute carrier family 25 (mitochondrial thiamine pyrophosphate transporter), member 19